jgi:hypothetical protein
MSMPLYTGHHYHASTGGGGNKFRHHLNLSQWQMYAQMMEIAIFFLEKPFQLALGH